MCLMEPDIRLEMDINHKEIKGFCPGLQDIPFYFHSYSDSA